MAALIWEKETRVAARSGRKVLANRKGGSFTFSDKLRQPARERFAKKRGIVETPA